MSEISKTTYAIQSFPASREFTMDVGKLGMRKHHIKALIEADVTDVRHRLRQHREESGKQVSFTVWLLKCIASAISEHKQVHAIRKGKNKLVIFDDVDISIMVEREVEGDQVPLPMVIRAVNRKTINEITADIDLAKSQSIQNEQDYILGKEKRKEPVKLFSILPQPIRLLIWRTLLSNPSRVKKMMGTVIMTSVGMMGKVNGWFIPYSMHPVCFAIGSIVEKPGVVNEAVEIREFLPVTILIDHDVIDGAPAARFVSRLTELLEMSPNL